MSAADEPLVGVVTPVYNGAAFLRECIESVIAQTYRNWRYTIVNNRSTDDTLEIARHYARLDSRIRVYDSPDFLPIIDNHNRAVGLLDPQATYCKPLMADDWLYPECIASMVALAQSYPSIGLVCSYARTRDEVRFTCLGGESGTTSFLSGRDACRRAILARCYFFGTPTTMLIRADLIRKRGPFYNPANLHADTESCYDILRESDFGFVHRVLAFFRVHESSMTSQVSGFDSLFVGSLYALAKYGRCYLTEAEFAASYASRMHEYYARLAAAVLRPSGRDFWAYHRAKLASVGAEFNRMRLARSVAAYAARRCLSPVAVAHSIWTWWGAALRRHRKPSKDPAL